MEVSSQMMQSTQQAQNTKPVQKVIEAPKQEAMPLRNETESTPKVEPAVRVEVSEAGKSAAAGRPPPQPVETEIAQKKSEHAQAAQSAGKRAAAESGVESLM